jgi:hypothetical protein
MWLEVRGRRSITLGVDTLVYSLRGTFKHAHSGVDISTHRVYTQTDKPAMEKEHN